MTIRFSFIIPCFNEESFIGSCITSIIEQDYPRNNYEIILVDNGSEDNSRKIGFELADTVVEAPTLKVGAVRNKGAKNARGEALIFIDADCTIDKSWLTRADKLFSSNSSAIYGGGAELPHDACWIEKSWLLQGPDGVSMPKELIGCSILISRENFESSGGFNPEMPSGEDSEFSIRLHKNGKSILINRSLNVIHHGNPKTIYEFMKRQAWHAKGYRKNLKKSASDPVFILINIFAATALTAVLLLLSGKTDKAILASIAFILLPGILTTKRFIRARCRPKDIKTAAKAYFLDFLYLTSRLTWILNP